MEDLRMIRNLAAISVLAVTLLAQEHVAPENLYTRVLCVVPLIGAGTLDDPKRPMFAPSLAVAKPVDGGAATDSPGIVAFQYQLSDDGNYALAEFVGIDRNALSEILNSTDSRVTVFERATATKQAIESELQKYKKTFSLDTYVPVRVQ
jgi:hypothetical protein